MSAIDIFFNMDVMARAFPILLRGLWMTLLLGITAIIFGSALGLGVALMRLYAPKPLRLLAITYTDLIRAMPVLVLLILIYYALPFVGVRFSPWTATILGFSMVMAAYSAEVFRAGIESVPKGQFEAAAALGIPFPVAFLKIVLPQAIRTIIPPMTSNCVSMFKETSLASTVAIPELLKESQDAQAYFANPTPLLGAALLYLLLLLPLVRLVSVLEARFGREKAR